MALKFHPKTGQLLMCDYTVGFVEPEMVKKRPVVVIAMGSSRTQLVTIVPLSTTPPTPELAHHWLVDRKLLPRLKFFLGKDSWLKGDMVNTVGFHRLSPLEMGRESASGRRLYYKDRFSRDTMRRIYSCVLAGLNLGDLAQHL